MKALRTIVIRYQTRERVISSEDRMSTSVFDLPRDRKRDPHFRIDLAWNV